MGTLILQNADTKNERNPPYELRNVCAVHFFAFFFHFLIIYGYRPM